MLAELLGAIRQEQAQRRHKMDDKRFTHFIIELVYITILFSLLFLSLWAWKEIVGWTLLGLLILCVGIHVWSQIDELRLRHARYHHKEAPLNIRRDPIQAQEAQTGPYYMPVA